MLQTRTSGRTAPALMRLSWRCPFRPQSAEKIERQNGIVAQTMPFCR
ncbi:hypothetical protein HMPREF1548_03968 [Clostridium sp. KLE 1755]|nr:hypothetical protein HMPREF1548_03968 [Clostridium sp. KLE 1755]